MQTNGIAIQKKYVPQPLSMDTSTFMLWVFIGTVVMIFASLTSAYLVKRSDGRWLIFELPTVLYYTSAIIFVSSITAQAAYYYAKRQQLFLMRALLMATVSLGILFLIGQFEAWKALVQSQVFLVGNPAGSFIYIITGLHGLHIISAIIVMLIGSIFYWKKSRSKKFDSFQLAVTYWHFLGFLWIYLFIFFMIFR